MATQVLNVREEESDAPPAVHLGNGKDLAARNKLVEENLSLVRWVVTHKFQWALQSSFEYEDLVGYGNLGLITAAQKFDPSRGNKFSTVAVWWIHQGISRSIMNEGDVIRMPVYMHGVRDKVQKVTQRIGSELRCAPTLQEIVKDAGVPEEQVILAFLYMQHYPASLNQATHDSNSDITIMAIGDFVPDTTIANPELLMEAQQELAAAKRRVNNLVASIASSGASQRDIEIFKMFYSFDGSDGRRTLGVVGERYNLTRERVRQIVRIVWEKAQDHGSDMDDEQLREELVRIEELGKIATSVFD